MPETILYGTKEISYFSISEVRKSIGITVTADLRVFVKAPRELHQDCIREKILKKGSWILKQLDYFSAFHPRKTTRLYRSWETHLYLGREYILDIKMSAQAESVKIKWKHIEVTCRDIDHVEKLMDKWYTKNAIEKIEDIFQSVSARFQKYGVCASQLKLRKMKTRWGSCSNKGSITINTHLIKASKACIEYVLVHEHCHLVHFNHTKKFYDLQEVEMKDWRKWKEKLEKLLA